MRRYLSKVAPAFLSPRLALCKLEGAGEVREGSTEAWRRFHPRCIRCGRRFCPFAKAGQDRRLPWVTEICELGFLLEMSWGMISPK